MKKENGKAKDKVKDKSGPVVDPAAAQQLNMMVLKRYDADIEELLVLNKLSTDNYVETLHDALDFEVHPPYLMYTHGNDEVVGVWFYENQDLEKVAGILEKIKIENPGDIAAAPAIAQAPPAPAASPAPADAPAQESTASNLQDLLFRAHQRHQQQHQHQQGPSNRPAQPKLANGHGPHPPQVPVQPPANIPIRPSPPQQSPQAATPTKDRRSTPPSPSLHQPQGAASQETPEPSPSSREASAGMGQLFSTPAPQSAGDGNVLHKLFARAMLPSAPATTPSPSPAAPAGPQQPAPQQQPQRAAADPAVRDKVRQAFGRLLQSDAFVDMLATEFKSAGLLS